ncbi:hypothetical protein E0H42_29975 [Rhizobium leguminosarum bv. viciae]|nr:hypothetical protein E0H42_29975 [Rhizobium leguminosarum bv. viciae]
MELDTADHRRSSGVTSGLHRMLTDYATIAEMLGQKTEAMAKHYSRLADTSKKMARRSAISMPR